MWIDAENAADLERARKLGIAGVDVQAGDDGQPRIWTSVRILDLDETRAKLAQLEAERDEAVARADVADYTGDALVTRCKDLEAQLDGKETGEVIPSTSGVRKSLSSPSQRTWRRRCVRPSGGQHERPRLVSEAP